jgi:hypothetical protein
MVTVGVSYARAVVRDGRIYMLYDSGIVCLEREIGLGELAVCFPATFAALVAEEKNSYLKKAGESKAARRSLQ